MTPVQPPRRHPVRTGTGRCRALCVALRGVDVKVILPSAGDSRLVDLAARSYFPELVSAGVHIFEYQPRFVHAKTMVIDGDLSIVGSANMDNRSFRLNFEVAAAFYDERIIRHLARRFEEDRRHSRTFPAQRRSAMVTQLLESIARLTSPVL